MTLFTLYEERYLSNGDVYWETVARGVSLQKAERIRQRMEQQRKHCAIQKYREDLIG